ncbi:MAG: ATP-binding cassette domain-containing protein [Flavobacteriales bacterium]|nr:ATP-binding cassette domain-containing protein [Flavobacteriales bacterium]
MITANLHKELSLASGNGALNVNLTFNHGVVTSLYGDSGVGKTMILRMLAGLEIPDGGSIEHNAQAWFADSRAKGPTIDKRQIGFVFQDYGLFPNMSVEENIQFAVADGNEALVQYYIEAFELNELKDKRPANLSGGQKQRTAIARALVFKPKILLLDEPFTAQDKRMSTIIGQEILKYTKEEQCVTILVTHNIAATMQLATYVYSISKGEVIKEGTVDEVFLGNSTQRNGIHGVVAEKVRSNDQENLIILANDQLFELRDEGDFDYEVGDEVFLTLDQKTKIFQLQKL